MAQAKRQHLNQLPHFVATDRNGQGLALFIRRSAYAEDRCNLTRVYIIVDSDTDEVAGYFSLKAGTVTANESRFFTVREFDSLPGVEIAHLAVNGEYKKKHPQVKHIGEKILNDFAFSIIKEANANIGIKVVYIFAIDHPRLIEYYKSIGFRRLSPKLERQMHRSIRPRYDSGCIFMYMPVESL